jgi:hypothetical protein
MMNTYKIINDSQGQPMCVNRSDGWSIPFAPDNTDYANFKKEVLAGAELQDADGNVMTQEQVNEFIKELP